MTSICSAAAPGLPNRQRLKTRLVRLSLPVPSGAGPRAVVEAEIERLIELLDWFDPDSDLEENGDLEPSLGSFMGSAQSADLELDMSDDEPSLGSLDRAIDQTGWSAGSADDVEEGDDDEPSLGWSNPLGARVDRRCHLIVERVPTKRIRRSEVHS